MEKRAILAAALMVGLLIVYQIWLAPAPPPPVEAPAETEPAPSLLPPPPVPLPPRVERRPAVPQRTVSVEGPLFVATVGSDGGTLHEWVLRYRGDKPLVVPGVLGPGGLVLRRPGAPAEVPAFEVSRRGLTLGPAQPEAEVRLTGEDAFGLRVTEVLKFHAEDFLIEVALRLENAQAAPQSVEVILPWSAPSTWPEEEEEQFQGQRPFRVSRLSRGQVEREETLEAVAEVAAEGKWIALESRYYIAALIPETPGFKLVTARANGRVEISLQASPVPLGPGETWEGRARLYVGPKEYDRLKALGVELEQTIHFGNFLRIPGLRLAWLAVPILWLMNFFYRLIPNYGVAIIMVTVITKILFYPLMLKQMGSMKAMQALAPQINALRDKHKKDPQRLQKETMDLYRKHGVNPLGGCLPLVVQMPIFISLFWVFQLAVELQNAEFLCFGTLFGTPLWICDLAQPDPTYILPILMGVSMFVQQKMTPTVGDPRQAKLMLMMPVVFTFFFLSLPSGLVLYWCVSNVLQIVQQHYMDRVPWLSKRSGKAGKEAQRA